MVFGLYGQALVPGIWRRAFGNSPGLEDAVYLQTQIIVQAAAGAMLLHYEDTSAEDCSLARGLGGDGKVPFSR
ncbi:MAG: hypothetical protein ACYDHX_06225 [Methanothrix sp.]